MLAVGARRGIEDKDKALRADIRHPTAEQRLRFASNSESLRTPAILAAWFSGNDGCLN